MVEQAQGEAAELNEENTQNDVDNQAEVSDNVITESENKEDSVSDVLSDVLSKISRLEGIQKAQTDKKAKLKEEAKQLKLQRKDTKDELRKAKNFKRKMNDMASETLWDRIRGLVA